MAQISLMACLINPSYVVLILLVIDATSGFVLLTGQANLSPCFSCTKFVYCMQAGRQSFLIIRCAKKLLKL